MWPIIPVICFASLRGGQGTFPASQSQSQELEQPSSQLTIALAHRFERLAQDLDAVVKSSAHSLAHKVESGLFEGATDKDIDQLAAETAAYQASMHPDYSRLASRVAVERIHACTEPSFAKTMRRLADHSHPLRGPCPLVSTEFAALAQRMGPLLDGAIRHERDFEYDYFGLRTLQRSYLLGTTDAGTPVERPQHMLMRVALAVHGEDTAAVLEAYDMMSRGEYTHATPTLFNSGCPRGQLCSCFLLTTEEDSVEGIFSTLTRCALISRSAGGIGVSVSHVRASGSYITSTGGKACGLVPMLRVFDATARYVDQGGGKRRGAFAIYLEPWHADVFEFLELRKNHGKEEARARDLFYALWVPDLFMRRVEAGENWSLFCPSEAPGLQDVWGDEFVALYERYEAEGRARRGIPAQQLWFAMLESQVETGTPYMLYKDSSNAKSNQRHLGTIRGSNLCTEIVQYTSADEVAVCNLASIALPKFVDADSASKVVAPDGVLSSTEGMDGSSGTIDSKRLPYGFNLERLRRCTYTVARALDRVISRNMYPLDEAKNSNFRHRPMGIGVQGLSDVFAMLSLPFESEEAQSLNKLIFETMYFGALQASCDMAAELGPYSTYMGSPASQGYLQFDLWGVTPTNTWDWASLRAKIAQHGLRNSLLIAPMPTASTSQILGNNECFEPYTSNLYARRTLAGEFYVLNKHLHKELTRLGLWSREMRDRILQAGGSVQSIPEIPEHIRCVFKTAWEMKQRTLIDMSAARGAYIDQSQSLNLFLSAPTFAQLSSVHFHAWRQGLKTGMYYLRSQPAAEAIKFTISGEKASTMTEECTTEEGAQVKDETMNCALGAGGPDCEACSG